MFSWQWALLGIILLVLETFNGGFYLLFIALSALLVAVFVSIDLVSTIALQWIFFAGFSLALLLVLRAPLVALTSSKRSRETDSIIGERALAIAPLEIDERGRIEFRGTTWEAINIGPSRLESGDGCFIVDRVGLLLKVKTER